MDTNRYWASTLQSRLSRRRALAAGSSVGLGALLAACGGGSKGDQTTQAASGLVTKMVDTAKQAKQGGVMKTSATQDYQTADPFFSNATVARVLQLTTSRLFNIKPGYLEPSAGELMGDLAESYEMSPDGLQITVTMRPNIFWHPIAPVNGRALDVDDINYSWKRFSEIGSFRSELLNSLDPNSPFLSMTTTGPRTLVFKLKFPLVGALGQLAPRLPGYLLFVPKEADGGFDVRNTIIGTGPWYLSEHVPSAGMTLKRHAKYHESGPPYFAELDMPIVTEYATSLAELKAGNIYGPQIESGSFALRAEDVLPTKRDVPDLLLYQLDLVANQSYAVFGWKPASAFVDERVRQAYSMAIDRDTWIDVLYNVSQFRDQGLPIQTGWNTNCLGCDFYTGWWLDPQGKDFGPNAKYFKHDLAEAKKLMAAAGYPNGTEQNSYIQAGSSQAIQVLEGMTAEAGIRFKTIPLTPNEYFPYRDSKGNHEGVVHRGTGTSQPDAIERINSEYGANASVFLQVLPEGKSDPVLDDLIAKGRMEFNTEKRKAIVNDIQRYLGKTQFSFKYPGGASKLDLAWPAVQNRYVYRGDQRVSEYQYAWLDETKAPFKKG